MARRSNAYSGYANPEIGEAFSNLARAMFGNAQDDQYIAAAQANRALAAKRQQEAQADADYQALLQQSAANPLFQARALEAMGFGPATVDNGNLIRPVAPDGPQMSVPVLPGQADPATQANIRNLARTMLGSGGNIQQSMAGFETLGNAATARLADQRLLNPGAFSEDQLRGATILRKGPAGVDADFAPTTEAQNRLQNFITQRSNYGDDRRLEGTKYGVDNKPVVVGQNATAMRPNGTVIGRGQQSPINVPEGGTLVIPNDRQADFGGQSQIKGSPKTTRSGSGGKPTKITGADRKAIDDQITGFEKTLNSTYDASNGIPAQLKQVLREEAAVRMRSGSDDEINNIPLATSRALKDFYGNAFVYNPTLGRKVVVPERIILDAQSAISGKADINKVLNVANTRYGIPREALEAALKARQKGQ